MGASQIVFLEELQRLESSLSILIPAAREMRESAPDAEFYRAEVPLAVEDARDVLRRLYKIAYDQTGAADAVAEAVPVQILKAGA